MIYEEREEDEHEKGQERGGRERGLFLNGEGMVDVRRLRRGPRGGGCERVYVFLSFFLEKKWLALFLGCDEFNLNSKPLFPLDK